MDYLFCTNIHNDETNIYKSVFISEIWILKVAICFKCMDYFRNPRPINSTHSTYCNSEFKTFESITSLFSDISKKCNNQ